MGIDATGSTASAARPSLLVCLGAFWPGNDSSGPNRSFAAFAAALSSEFDIRLLARARPFGVAGMRPTRDWLAQGDYAARYCEVGPLGARGLTRTLRATPHDVLILNGFFDREFTIPSLVARAAGLVPRRATILSPRGEFSGGALALKSGRKAAWLSFVRATGLLADVTIHATSERERDEIAAALPGARRFAVAPNVRALIDAPALAPRADDRLRVVFVGRIATVKNLDFALTALSRVRTPVRFDVFGPRSDEAYAHRCQSLADALPSHVEVHWRGEIPNEDVPKAMAQADLLFLPSRSENFGHAIFEALACGTPVLIGDATPWRDLERDTAGFDLALDDPAKFAAAIDRFAHESAETRARFRAGARKRAERWVVESDAAARARTMVRDAIAAGVPSTGPLRGARERTHA